MRPHNVFDTFNGAAGWLPFAALDDFLDTSSPAWLSANTYQLDQAYVYTRPRNRLADMPKYSLRETPRTRPAETTCITGRTIQYRP